MHWVKLIEQGDLAKLLLSVTLREAALWAGSLSVSPTQGRTSLSEM